MRAGELVHGQRRARALGAPLLRVIAGQAHPGEEFSRTEEQGFRDGVRFVREAWAAA